MHHTTMFPDVTHAISVLIYRGNLIIFFTFFCCVEGKALRVCVLQVREELCRCVNLCDREDKCYITSKCYSGYSCSTVEGLWCVLVVLIACLGVVEVHDSSLHGVVVVVVVVDL